MTTTDIQIVQVPPKDLKASEYNPRKMTDKQVKDLRESIETFGLVDPIIVNQHPGRENIVIGGHQRLRIATELGYETVPVVYINVDNEKERELNLRLNKNLGMFDYDILANMFDAGTLLKVGFSREEIDFFETTEDEFNVEDELNSISVAKAQRGDIYQLGPHRLMCGDSTLKEDVEKLMDGKKANMIFTDPPYNVNYTYAKYETLHKGRKKKFMDGGKIFNDNKDEISFYHFLLDVFKNAYEFSTDEMALYVCFATKSQLPFVAAFRDSGFLFSQTIIWLKERIILALGQDYHRVYEPILFGWKEGKKHYKNKTITTEKELWNLDKKTFEEQLDVWYIPRDKSSDYIHPTQKPIRLADRAMRKNSHKGDILYEPFNGSGSTMMASEQAGRICYGMELDPKYVDVAIKRWEFFTKKEAVKIQ